jgi:Ca2+-binding EF-hand superfamily protein
MAVPLETAMPAAPLLLRILASAAAASSPITVTGHAWAPFISPMGEPFRARAATDDTLARWFRQADRNGDGVLTADEMRADAERFFATLDSDADGQIDPDELAHYEYEIAPDIQVMSPRRRAPGEAAPASRRGSALERDASGRHRERLEVEQLGLGGALQGAARYGLLNMPEPVAAADTDFNRAITLEEFRLAADRRFQLLDTAHDGKLTLAPLEAIRSAALDNRRGKRNAEGDKRIGNGLPPEN